MFSEVILIPEIVPSLQGVNIYIDESGDLGFTGKTSPYFVIAAIIAQGPDQVQKCKTCMKRTLRKLPKKYKNIAELKHHNTDDTYRRRILERDNSHNTEEYQLEVTHVDSRQNLGVQAVDFIAGAIHRHYRENMPSKDHYHIIEDNISIVLDYFNGRQK